MKNDFQLIVTKPSVSIIWKIHIDLKKKLKNTLNYNSPIYQGV